LHGHQDVIDHGNLRARAVRGVGSAHRGGAHGIRRQVRRDVTRNRQGAGAGPCRIGMAGGRDLHCRR
jgi:hypothetical protein